MEETFDAILPELMSQPGVTHFHFPRKWIVNLNPCEYVQAAPWFPNWALRMFRNDANIVWKQPRPHSQYSVQGTGWLESRTSILHFEPLLCAGAERQKKIESYRRAGSKGAAEEYYTSAEGYPRHPVKLRAAITPQSRWHHARIHSEITELQVAMLPPWCATILSASLPPLAPAGSTVFVEVLVRNTGKLSWEPPSGRWPLLNLGFHLLNLEGEVINLDGGRFTMPKVVPPGGEVQFLGELKAPSTPGSYLLEWDMVSEGECWFANCGSTVLRTHLQVTDKVTVTDTGGALRRAWKRLTAKG
jgi:hypothetical protein